MYWMIKNKGKRCYRTRPTGVEKNDDFLVTVYIFFSLFDEMHLFHSLVRISSTFGGLLNTYISLQLGRCSIHKILTFSQVKY